MPYEHQCAICNYIGCTPEQYPPITVDDGAAVAAIVNLDYHSGSETPYRQMPHGEHGKKYDWQTIMRHLLLVLGVEDGEEYFITLSRSGRRPLGERKMRLVRAHTYELDPAPAQEA